MSSSLIIHMLFAQISRWQRLGDGLHRGRGRADLMELVPFVIMLAAVAALITIVVRVRKRNDMKEQCNDPDKLFRELILAHRLNRPSQKLLRRLAEAFQLDQPAEIFLQPALFQAETLPLELRGEAASFQELQQRLF